ncbi:MAG TPA: patatin-like phospholipase family protein [Gammaproteobacteria bacterium]
MIKQFSHILILLLLSLAIKSVFAGEEYSFAIKGGVSLGSYEAGLNWVLIEELRYQVIQNNARLNTFTGSSAGSINTIMSAVRYCQSDSGSNVKDNLFRKAWNIGLKNMATLPGDHHAKIDYREITDNLEVYLKQPQRRQKARDKGGVFSRRGLLPSIQLIYNEIHNNKNTYREGCSVNIGIAVTKLFPEKSTVDGIDLRTQRFVFPLQMFVQNGEVKFRNLSPEDKRFTSLDQFIYLPEVNGLVQTHEVLKLALASSAFPIAFAPVNLSYCIAPRKNSAYNRNECPVNYESRQDLFVDGGSLDNAPIGVALGITDHFADVRQAVFGYINPGRLRERESAASVFDVSAPKGISSSEYIAGISDYMRLGFHLLDYGMSAELHNTVREFNQKRRETNTSYPLLYSTTRFYPVVGDYLAHFAAFFDGAFRSFDFNVGVYDGVLNVARYLCARDKGVQQLNMTLPENITCVGNRAGEIYSRLSIHDGDGVDIFAALALREFRTRLYEEGWQWLNANEILNQHKNSANLVVFSALDHSGCVYDHVCQNKIEVPDFDIFLGRLKPRKHFEEHTQAMIRNPRLWVYPIMLTTLDRMRDVEHQKKNQLKARGLNEQADIQELYVKLVEVSTFAGRTIAMKQENNVWPSSTAGELGNIERILVPDEIGGDIRSGGFYFSYNWDYQLGKSPWVVEPSFTPYHGINSDLYPSPNMSVGVSMRYHLQGPMLSSIGIGPVLYRDWNREPGFDTYTTGFEVELGLIGDKLRITSGQRYLDGNDDIQYYLLLGITDIKGIYKWLF